MVSDALEERPLNHVVDFTHIDFKSTIPSSSPRARLKAMVALKLPDHDIVSDMAPSNEGALILVDD